MFRFQIRGLARFLSHAETLRLLGRACVRADMDMAYSKGFNPRPKLSLALPRSVSVESDDELCSVQIRRDNADCDTEQLKEKLARQLPGGFELTSVEISNRSRSFQRGVVTYQITVKEDFAGGLLTEKIETLMSAEQLIVQRYRFDKGKSRQIDLKPFLESIDIIAGRLTARCGFTPSGTVRVDELMQLLELNWEQLACPVRRTEINWLN